jgi:hypothetical protein
MQDHNYDLQVKDKTTEQILAAPNCSYDGLIGYDLRVAAQVRTNQDFSRGVGEGQLKAPRS